MGPHPEQLLLVGPLQERVLLVQLLRVMPHPEQLLLGGRLQGWVLLVSVLAREQCLGWLAWAGLALVWHRGHPMVELAQQHLGRYGRWERG